jgi:hypothetical protein
MAWNREYPNMCRARVSKVDHQAWETTPQVIPWVPGGATDQDGWGMRWGTCNGGFIRWKESHVDGKEVWDRIKADEKFVQGALGDWTANPRVRACYFFRFLINFFFQFSFFLFLKFYLALFSDGQEDSSVNYNTELTRILYFPIILSQLAYHVYFLICRLTKLSVLFSVKEI